MQRTKPQRRPNPNRKLALTTVAIAFTKRHDLRLSPSSLFDFKAIKSLIEGSLEVREKTVLAKKDATSESERVTECAYSSELKSVFQVILLLSTASEISASLASCNLPVVSEKDHDEAWPRSSLNSSATSFGKME